jgi:protein required for attachment to host cells
VVVCHGTRSLIGTCAEPFATSSIELRGTYPFRRRLRMPIAIPHDAMVLVADGKKALFLRKVNGVDGQSASLKTEMVMTDENPATRDQGTDRPGHAIKNAASQRRTGFEPTDWHDIEEHRFARRVAAKTGELVQAHQVRSLFIAAPPRTLAELRRSLDDDVKRRIVVELDKDLTGHSVTDIEKHMLA